ncbi:MAG TPA: HAMP domain-containing sensor histidine kinase [Ktedonobacteraceae bacterium]|nr:HAMP domain-containing sensor histidine kinase [Ktedonobacteraceae bacterium]
MKRWSSPFFTQRPARAILASLVIGVVFQSALLLQPFLSFFIWRLLICLAIGLICVIFSAFLLQLPTGSRRQQMLFEASIGSILSLLLSCAELATLLILLRGASLNPLWQGSSRPLLTALIALLLNVAVFLTFRMSIRLWLFWNRLRRRQLLWALTYAHVMILLLGAVVLLVVFEAPVIYNSPNNVFLVVSATLGLLVLSLIALLVVLPLSALFSYLVTRPTVRRLQTLATATGALRRGNYAIRVPVNGEDEVAQLQADFNGMAADLEQAVRELQGERERVAAVLQERQEMIATVSHELRTPVATLRGHLETILLHWGEPATFHHDLEVMEQEVEHLQFLVEDLFTLARTDIGRLALQCELADIGKIARRIVETMAPLAWRTSKIEMVAEVPSELPLAAVDVNRLEQALQNLLHNAIRHTSPGGIIAITVRTEPGTLVLQVKDTGEGIAPEDLPHIWERFYQAGSTPTRIGAGLGLSLVKEWIEAMGGSVAVESAPGAGSCFILRLPQPPP